ncbi:hypothetical protein [Mesorhizobium sp. LSHC414A00]|uniref:hypothetical protein n=1 Tax=Mesorhizobium sp. LSHC414A00 TaxID=1287287 RepID=UPI0003CDF290|nr:hypothetical protein [Mesorhizobium sp. LSHC414A00]ESX78463.1 hypothetical protein X757_08800 [Mesorhizobium sp. LSHC414A00]
MAFNSNTYQANKSAKSAREWIAKAKDVKVRAAEGNAYAWEIDRIPTMVYYARADMHRALFFRTCGK